MEKSIDRKHIRITGLIETADLFEIGDDMLIALKGSVVKTEVKDNQDGSVNIVYSVKPYEAKFEKP